MRTLRPRPDSYKSDRCQRILTNLRSTVQVMDRPATRRASRSHPGPPPRRRACRALDLHRRTRHSAALYRRPPEGPSRPRRSRGRPPRTHKGPQRLQNTGAAPTASKTFPRPLPTASRPPFVPKPPRRPPATESRRNRLKIQKETTHRHHSRKRRRPTRNNHERTASGAAGVLQEALERVDTK